MVVAAATLLIFVLVSTVVYLVFRLKKKTLQYNSQLGLLKQLSEENRTLLGILFHDLSTPISVLEFAVRRLEAETEVLNEPVRFDRNIQKILQSLSLMRDILAKVKSLQEVRTGKRPLSLEKVDPVQVTRELAEMFDDRLKEKNLELHIESYLEGNCMIQADRTLLKNEVLSNLLSNAIKFSPRNRIIEVSFLRENEQHILIQIRDYGIGIPGDLIPKIFDYTEKTSRLGTNDEAGTGFGLPLAKTCTQLMCGSIDVESYTYQPGVSSSGTAFNLRFLIENTSQAA
ncbi:MAG: sensor histidine kinase [Pseudobdellovibrionaceae bacterium]